MIEALKQHPQDIAIALAIAVSVVVSSAVCYFASRNMK